ncbi:MAG: hypothetical protein RBS80_29765 [Thermoguttaceae bacterium]|jgi:hypothetical protein|nr:hypothetical protein [Thermoguttaceae bacterium]
MYAILTHLRLLANCRQAVVIPFRGGLGLVYRRSFAVYFLDWPEGCWVAGTGWQLEFTLQRVNHAGAESGTLKRELQQYDRVAAALS